MPIPQYKKWDITKGSLTINSVPILGLKKGDFITAAYEEDRHTTHMSADNFGRHSKNPNKNGTVGIGIAGASPALSVIQTFIDLDEPLIISFVDGTSPGSHVLASDAVIQKEPDYIKNEGVPDVDWMFTVTKLSFKHRSPAEVI